MSLAYMHQRCLRQPCRATLSLLLLTRDTSMCLPRFRRQASAQLPSPAQRLCRVGFVGSLCRLLHFCSCNRSLIGFEARFRSCATGPISQASRLRQCRTAWQTAWRQVAAALCRHAVQCHQGAMPGPLCRRDAALSRFRYHSGDTFDVFCLSKSHRELQCTWKGLGFTFNPMRMLAPISMRSATVKSALTRDLKARVASMI